MQLNGNANRLSLGLDNHVIKFAVLMISNPHCLIVHAKDFRTQNRTITARVFSIQKKKQESVYLKNSWSSQQITNNTRNGS